MANAKFDCELCNVTTYDQHSYETHLLGDKHQTILLVKLRTERKQKCGIYVTGYSKDISDEQLIALFGEKFGEIHEHYFNRTGNFLLINFKNEQSAQEALTTKLYYEEQLITVRPRTVKKLPSEKQPIPKNTATAVSLQTILSNYPNFDTQVKILVEVLQPSEHEMQSKYGLLCYDLQRCLATIFPHCQVWPFGSTVSGLHFRDSDVDVHVPMPPLVHNATYKRPSSVDCVNEARNVLQKFNLFSNIVAITHARTPIIKCVHIATRVSCDFNFENMLGVCNSQLIRYMLSLDPRLKHFMIVIKYWAKVHGVSGSGRMTNYSLAMLSIFYLQNIPNPILPPVWILQVPEFRNIQAGWNSGFCGNPALRAPVRNTLSLFELLHGFFKFCAKFDYGLYVISPLTGQFYSKLDFARPEKLPDTFFHYKAMLATVRPLKTDCAICLQDPFELNHNLTGNVWLRTLQNFKSSCDVSVALCETYGPSKLLLTKIFEQFVMRSKVLSDDKCEFSISVGKTMACVEKSVDPDVSDKSTVLRRLWFEKVYQFLISVLTKILLLQVTVKKIVPQSKLKKIEGQADIHDDSVEDSLQFHCSGCSNVWAGRRGVQRLLRVSADTDGMNFFDQEIAISNYIVDEICKDLDKTQTIVDFNLIVNCRTEPTQAEFLLNDVKSKKDSFKQMASLLFSRFFVWFEKHMTLENNKEDILAENRTESDQNIKVNEKLSEV